MADINSPFRKELFARDWRVLVGVPYRDNSGVSGLDVTGLDCEWEIEKDLTAEPNKCSLKIFNLKPEYRHALESANIYDPKKPKKSQTSDKTVSHKQVKTGNIRVEIEAGYKDTGRSLLFRGDLRRALSSMQDDKTWVTTIEGEDGGRSVLSSRVCESFPAGTRRRTVVERCASALGLGLGNILQVEHLLAQTYSHGTVLDGPAARELAGVLRRAGIRYSIQDGALLFLETAKGRTRKAVKLDRASGLVGAPERDTNGLVLATSLLNPDLVVGGYVFLESKDIQGVFVVEKVTYDCSTHGTSWYAKLELRAG